MFTEQEIAYIMFKTNTANCLEFNGKITFLMKVLFAFNCNPNNITALSEIKKLLMKEYFRESICYYLEKYENGELNDKDYK